MIDYDEAYKDFDDNMGVELVTDAKVVVDYMNDQKNKVSKEQYMKLKEILKNVMVGRLADDVIKEFLKELNLEKNFE